MNKLKGFSALFTAAILFASFNIWVRMLAEAMGPYQQILFRNVIALVLSLGVVLYLRQSFSSLKNVKPLHATLYTLTFPLAVVFYTLSVLETKIVTIILGFYLGSLVTSLLVGTFFFKEKITPLKLLSLLLVGLGLATYVYPFEREVLGIGLLFGIIAGFFDAVANSFRKFLGGKVDRFILVALQMMGGIVVALPLMLLFGQTGSPELTGSTWIVGLIFGASLVAISYLSLVGFQNFDLNLGTIVLSSEIFFAAVLALLVYGEQTTNNELMGGVLIMLATVIANLSFEKESRWQRLLDRAAFWKALGARK